MNVILPGDGTAVATVTVDGAEQQVVQVSSLPAVTLDAAALAALANAATPAIQPVSAQALPLPAGAATESTAATPSRRAAATSAGRMNFQTVKR